MSKGSLRVHPEIHPDDIRDAKNGEDRSYESWASGDEDDDHDEDTLGVVSSAETNAGKEKMAARSLRKAGFLIASKMASLPSRRRTKEVQVVESPLPPKEVTPPLAIATPDIAPAITSVDRVFPLTAINTEEMFDASHAAQAPRMAIIRKVTHVLLNLHATHTALFLVTCLLLSTPVFYYNVNRFSALAEGLAEWIFACKLIDPEIHPKYDFKAGLILGMAAVPVLVVFEIIWTGFLFIMPHAISWCTRSFKRHRSWWILSAGTLLGLYIRRLVDAPSQLIETVLPAE